MIDYAVIDRLTMQECPEYARMPRARRFALIHRAVTVEYPRMYPGLGITGGEIVVLIVGIVVALAGTTATIVSLAVSAKKESEVSRIQANTAEYVAKARALKTQADQVKQERIREEWVMKGAMFGALGLSGILVILNMTK